MKEKVVNLQELLEAGIHYEKMQDFPKSIYKNVYEGAEEAVRQIMADNQGEKWGESKKRRNTEIANVISFVGRRGTGKTSSMMSFGDALRNYNGKQGGLDKKEPWGDVGFFLLECIDASALEESESIFTIVLANILSKIDEYSEKGNGDCGNYQKRSLLKRLERIYKNYISLTDSQSSGQREYSAYENLSNLASSQNIRTQFDELVKECLEYFCTYYDHPVKEAYLVIAIDDVDMAHYNKREARVGQLNIRSYEVMRLISKYFSIPGVIVLAAYNHINLQQQCSTFFAGSNFTKNHETDESLKSGERLAIEFMQKVFTPIYRVYMPSWKKWDYNERNIKVNVGKGGGSEDIFYRFCCGNQKFGFKSKRIFSIKELLLIIYAEKLGVYYDCEGKKRHFLEPDSLRELSNILYRLIEPNVSLKKKDSIFCIKKDEKREIIFKHMMDDIYFRFVQERLYLEKERALFYDLLERQIDRRGKKIVQLVAPLVQPLGRTNRQIVKLLKEARREYLQYSDENIYAFTDLEWVINKLEDNSDASYSYAELVHSIYHMSRIGKKLYSRELVACILHSYSIALVQVYNAYEKAKREIMELEDKHHDFITQYKKLLSNEHEESEWQEKLEIIEGYSKVLEGVVGDTVLGKWSEYYFPKVYDSTYDQIDKSQAVVIGGGDGVRGTGFKFRFSVEAESKDTDISSMLKGCIFVMMMYPNLRQWRNIDVEIRQGGDGFTWVDIDYDGEANFELTSFINCSIFYPQYLYKMEQLLNNAFQEKSGEKESEKKLKGRIQDSISNIFQELWESYYQWDKKYGNMILPIQYFDLMYNMIKHLFQEGERKYEYAIDLGGKGVFIREFANMLEWIKKYLGKIDKFYYLEDAQSFVEKFEYCPYFDLLRKIKSDEACVKCIDVYIRNIANAVYNSYMLDLAADESKGEILM